METTLKEAIDAIRPEAREIIAAARKDITTKDGYGFVMGLMGKMPATYQKILLVALAAEGYPQETVLALADIFAL